ncbi:hypothetical protein DPMN_171995 [Dreissena polymorpha]|uniref:Uncharacterized protein n=1 Tax=Dreissena polymorpha TaxID=45954 RepID=A0A9D4IG39_DREPO|nr:hypothetical protein DPMN_171995 [Dreissena polymorpha]
MSHGVGAGKNPSANKIAPTVAVYAIVMNARNEKLPAWHRLTTVVSIKGHLVDSVSSRVCPSTFSKDRDLCWG